MEALKGIPIFCVESHIKGTNRLLYINFKSTDQVEGPELDLDEEELVEELRKGHDGGPTTTIENYKIPLKISQIYWTPGDEAERQYVVDVHLNDKFAIRRVLIGEVMRGYLVFVTIMTLEEKYSSEKSAKVCGQNIGHKLDIDQTNYEILTNKQCQEKSLEIVNNKVSVIEEYASSISSSTCKSSDFTNSYDLHYRPGSKILTCSITTDRLPDSVSFNDDTIQVKVKDRTILDVSLPFFIDVRQPAKYKFDDKLCLLRIVFKIMESK